MYALNSESTQKRTAKIIHGIGRPRLNLSEIISIVLPLPPTHEQEIIFGEIERRLSVVREVENQVEIELERVDHFRQSILKKAFSGKLLPQNMLDGPLNA